MEGHASKKQKIDKEWNMDKNRDRIGPLPDSLLERILSFLPTKDAVKTGILSRRWQQLWMSVPILSFEEGAPEPDKRTLFMNFVEKQVGLRDSYNIQKFSLTCDVLSDASRIYQWICDAVNYNVQSLNLCLKNALEPFVLPSFLFTCESLVVLELNMSIHLRLPNDICFSRLKKLGLSNVVFPDDHLTRRLFSGCPVLEELRIFNCGWENVKAVCISAPMLRELTITGDKGTGDDDADDENDVTNEQNDSHGCQFVIFGPRLQSFSFCGDLIHDYCLFNSSSLVNASFELKKKHGKGEIVPEMTREDAFRAFKLLRGLSDVKNLELSLDVFEALNCAKELFAQLPMFSNLTYLQLADPLLSINIACGGLVSILRSSPYLDTVEFYAAIVLKTSDGKDEWILDPLPSCFSTHLKTIIIHDFTGDKDEIAAVKFLLKNARCLERIIFDFFIFGGKLQKLKAVEEQLRLLLTDSQNCEIEFWNNPLEVIS